MKPATKFTLAICILLGIGPLAGAQQVVRDLDITMTLTDKGSVIVHEAWDLNTGTGITEWYLVRENLGDITIPSLYMSEKGVEYENVGEWDVNKTLSEKAYKCGIVHKSDGMELCWGIGSYGDHVYHPVYGMVRAVKALNDYDMLHLQVVSPGLSSPPQHVRVTVQSDDFQLDTLNTRLWGFGYEGMAEIRDGKAVFESEQPLDTEDSVIILLRFEKGLMQPISVQERDFQDALDKALAGSDYLMKEEDDKTSKGIAYFFTALIMFLMGRGVYRRATGKKYAYWKFKGIKEKEIGWYRDIPLDGDLEVAYQFQEDMYVVSKHNNLPMAMILRMIYKGYIGVTRDLEGPVKLSFNAGDTSVRKEMGANYGRLYLIMQMAAGENKLLEEKEFSNWMKRHEKQAYDWLESVKNNAQAYLRVHDLVNGSYYTDSGKKEAIKLLGLKKFLKDFTLSKEREAIDVKLWKEYLVYAGLFGLAEKVAKQLKDIDPALFRQTLPYDYDTLSTTLTTLGSFSRAVSLSSYNYKSSLESSHSSSSGHSSYSRSSGGGGHSSRSGGGGYSGGGRGGGGR